MFLGTGGSVPTARRATACLLARVGGDRLLFDCGEGSQRQMQRSTGLVQVDEVYVTHYHADHYLGLPGLLKTYDLQGRERSLRIVGPPGLRGLFEALHRIVGRISYEIELVELDEGDAVRHQGYEVRCFQVEHQVRAHGYALVEDQRPGRFDPELAASLGVQPGPDFGKLQSGEAVAGDGRPDSPRAGDGRASPGPQGRDHRGYGAVRDDPGGRPRGGAAGPRWELRRRRARTSGRDRPLDGAAGRGAGTGSGGEALDPGPRLLALRRPRRPRPGAGGIPRERGAARLRPGRDPLPRARRAAAGGKRGADAGAAQG